jgi:hypothetical protein
MPPYRPEAERFWEKVRKTETCWLWTGTSVNGYGYFHLGRERSKNVSAHRWAYANANGPIPEGLEIDHLCRVRACVRPDHLEAVTRTVNIRRAPSANGKKTHCKRGHEFTPENTYLNTSGGRERRVCRECIRTHQRQWDRTNRPYRYDEGARDYKRRWRAAKKAA